jgi:hypothetical protein
LMIALSFLIPEGESQQAEGLLEDPLLRPPGADSLCSLGLTLLSTKAGLKGNNPALYQLELTFCSIKASC